MGAGSASSFFRAAVSACALCLLAAPGHSAEGPALFTINGTPVEARELLAFVDIQSGGEPAGADLPGTVDTLINNRLMAEAAIREGIDRQPRVRSRIEGRGNKLWSRVYWDFLAGASVAPTDRELLESAPAFDEMLSLQQLIVESPDLAAQLRRRALEGDDFDALVRSGSVGLTSRNSGRVGYVKRTSTMYEPRTLEALFALPTGSYSPVLPTRLGYSVFKILDRKSPESQKGEWLAANRDRLTRDKLGKSWDDRRATLVESHAVVVNHDLIDRYGKAVSEKRSPGPLLQEIALEIDDVDFFLGDLLDPADIGLAHSTSTLETLMNKRVEEFAVAREVERLGLKKSNQDIVLRERLLAESVYAREYVNHRCRDIAVSPEEIKAQYERNRSAYTAPRALDISLIETKSPARLESIYALLAKGTPFGTVAERLSDNRTLPGGRVGFVAERSLSPEFAGIGKLRAGSYSPTPIRVAAAGGDDERYVVVMLHSVREAEPIPFESVEKADLVNAVMAGKRARVVRNILAELRKSNKVRFTPEYERFAATFGKGR
jgi:parvulin-like peptidyl-prolyl isomerase